MLVILGNKELIYQNLYYNSSFTIILTKTKKNLRDIKNNNIIIMFDKSKYCMTKAQKKRWRLLEMFHLIKIKTYQEFYG